MAIDPKEIERQSTRLDIHIDKGSELVAPFGWTAGLTKTSQYPVDLTNASIELKIFNETSEELLDTLSTAGGQIVSGGADGTFEVTFATAVTDLWDWQKGQAVYTLIATPENGTPRKLYHGFVNYYGNTDVT